MYKLHIRLIYYTFFSKCDSEWTDCVAEDNKYLGMTNFNNLNTNQCSVSQTNSNNQCSEDRSCKNTELAEGEDLFVGYTSPGECTCPSVGRSHSTYPVVLRYKRQTNERLCRRIDRRSCRILRTRRGGKRRFCDKISRLCPNSYREAVRIAPTPPAARDVCNPDSEFKDAACEFLTGF